MANEINDVMDAATETEPQDWGVSPQIIVTGTAEKPFYQIMYRDNKDGEIHLGFGSFSLPFVFQWLKEYFGVTHAHAVDPESLRPTGRKERSVISKTGLMCTNCYSDVDLDAVFCKYCGAKVEG